MVGHIVIGVVRDDEVGVGVADDVHENIAGLFSVVEDLQIVKAAGDDLDPRERACLFRLVRADDAQLVRRNDHVTQIAARNVADDDLVAALDAFCEGAGARDLHVVGMTADCKNIHRNTCFFSFVIRGTIIAPLPPSGK